MQSFGATAPLLGTANQAMVSASSSHTILPACILSQLDMFDLHTPNACPRSLHKCILVRCCHNCAAVRNHSHGLFLRPITVLYGSARRNQRKRARDVGIKPRT